MCSNIHDYMLVQIKQLESENTECKMKQENCTRTIEALTRRNTELETDLRDVTQEFTVLKTNYTTVLQGYENEVNFGCRTDG